MTKISRTTDMTQSSEMRHIIMFSLPLLAGNLLQQTYNIVDTMVVGRYLGDGALAAVGATGSITYLFYTLCIGLSVGAGIIVAQYFGAGKKKALRSAVFNSALVTAIFGIVISLLSVPATRPILELLKVPDKLIGDSVAYMQIACGGTIAVAAYNWINAIMRALGDSKTPLIFLGAASLLNALLDLLFVVVFKFGIAGAAWATVLTQALSAISCIVYCFAVSREIKLTADDLHADKDMMSRCVKTGVPIAIQNGLISVSMVALQRVTNGFGETVMATYTVSMRIEQFVQQPFSSLNAAVSTFTGQNIGAGKEKRAQKGPCLCNKDIGDILGSGACTVHTVWRCNNILVCQGQDCYKHIGKSAYHNLTFLLVAGYYPHHKRIFERRRRYKLCPCKRHGGGNMQDRSFTYPHKDSFHRLLGHMVHHRCNVVCDRYGEPYKIQGWKMEASCHSEIDFHNCCTDWVRQFF